MDPSSVTVDALSEAVSLKLESGGEMTGTEALGSTLSASPAEDGAVDVGRSASFGGRIAILPCIDDAGSLTNALGGAMSRADDGDAVDVGDGLSTSCEDSWGTAVDAFERIASSTFEAEGSTTLEAFGVMEPGVGLPLCFCFPSSSRRPK